MENGRYIIIGHAIYWEFNIEKYVLKANYWILSITFNQKTIQQIKNMVKPGNKTKW